MKQLIILCGPPGSGKSTLAKEYEASGFVRISQDDSGKMHIDNFNNSIVENDDIIVDRMGFNKEQRKRYLGPAKQLGYQTKIIVLHQNQATCLDRCLKREGHPTIQDEKSARSALHTFFSKYQRPEPGEADEIEFRYPEGPKLTCIVSDIDNTLANTSHREHHVNGPGKKNWKAFFDAMGDDEVNGWCGDILNSFSYVLKEYRPTVLLVSARPDNYRNITESWLLHNDIGYDNLIMRERGDHREDSLVKEILMDFEILTKYEILFWIDDRKRVIEKIRSRGVTVLDCAGPKGDF